MRISDWSSDVCSSDLHSDIHASIRAVNGPVDDSIRSDKLFDYRLIAVGAPSVASGAWPLRTPAALKNATLLHSLARPEIGRASCRERVCQYVSIPGVAVSLKK